MSQDSIEQHPKEYPVIISIDFGTTYSGCCYALSNSNEIHDIIKWPKSNGFYAKVPTLLYYKNKNNKLLDWGKSARLLSLRPDYDGTLYQCFKLSLMNADGYHSAPNKTPQNIIADYLRLFHEYICEELQKTPLLKSYKQDQYRYCLTVPAIWSDQAKQLMRESVIEADILSPNDPIHRLELISEPEAAAAYCENKYNSWNLTNNNIFMIIDAGGGTVDLITYMIEEEEGKRTIKEVTRGEGGMCGSSFIDNNMRALLKAKLQQNHIPTCMFEQMMEVFIERIKPNYHPNQHDNNVMEVPAGILQFIPTELLNENDELLLDSQELKDLVFDPVLKQVILLVKHQLMQIEQFVDAIFLVGGFGCSEYLYQLLKLEFGNVVGEIVMPPRGELAVAQGSIYTVLKPDLVSSKILRKTYGVRSKLPFEQGLDPIDSIIITNDGIKRCSTRFDVIAEKGKRIFFKEKITRHYWIEYPKHTEADLYVCEADTIPRQITDDSITQLVQLPIKMPILTDVSPGERVDIKIDFVFGLTEIKIMIQIANITTEHVIGNL